MGQGLYATVQPLAKLAALPANTLSHWVTSSVSREAKHSEKRAHLRKAVWLATAASMVAVGVLLLKGDVVTTALFGSAFAEAAVLAKILSVGALISGITMLLDAFFRAGRRPYFLITIRLVTAVAVIAFIVTANDGERDMAMTLAFTWAIAQLAPLVFALRRLQLINHGSAREHKNG
jgi:O-antigen/teichoic acid export membrane protein